MQGLHTIALMAAQRRERPAGVPKILGKAPRNRRVVMRIRWPREQRPCNGISTIVFRHKSP